MADEADWGADTVALGRGVADDPEAWARGRSRSARRSARLIAVATAAGALLVAGALLLGTGSSPGPAAVRPAASSPSRVPSRVVRQPHRHGRRSPDRARGRRHRPMPARTRRKPGGTTPPVPPRRAPAPESPSGAVSEPAPTTEAPVSEPEVGPVPVRPTPPAVEFGM